MHDPKHFTIIDMADTISFLKQTLTEQGNLIECQGKKLVDLEGENLELRTVNQSIERELQAKQATHNLELEELTGIIEVLTEQLADIPAKPDSPC